MSENDHQPVKLTGVLLLAAIALVFLVVIWLIGTAFARTGIVYVGSATERMTYGSVVLR
ncbi:hypothetical protein [Phyllobacterium zundukense]|uniref:Uncharacterized protein n=1 Tax=Phyllobacterium zundukense TaxID=1867719 RepID=A0ACD4D521_9HYPH|nr:hypothetical protein [Phyllobacterium zundukense]UXN61027.1 hypothetical protein N8E88_13050 [Phyllobacterium zundukense]